MFSHKSIAWSGKRPGWLRAVGFLAVLALLAGGLGLRAAPAPAPKEEPKKEEPKKQASSPLDDIDFEGILREMSPTMNPEMARRMIEQMKRSVEYARQVAGQNGMSMGFGPFGMSQEPRLGVYPRKPNATLVEQLDLPKGQGLVLEGVEPDSAAAKAGLKAHDILLELNGKPVSSDPLELRKQLEDIKANTPVEAVVLRKGKRETLKDLSLPEAKARPAFPGFPFPPPVVPQLPVLPAFPALGDAPAGNGVLTTTFRTGDHFTTRHQEGSLIITVTGTVADGKAKVNEIQVQDGTASHKYESADKVDEQYRDKVKNLVEMSEKSSVKVEIKSP
jgi:membrane-associated protease RseP (regulator of RpoE activity)